MDRLESAKDLGGFAYQGVHTEMISYRQVEFEK